MPSFATTIKKELFSVKLVLITLLSALLYLSLSIFLLNSKLFVTLIGAHTSLIELFQLFFSLFGGLWTSLSLVDFILTLINAILVGLNLALLLRTIYLLEHKGKLHLSIGGATLMSIVATGCTSCGLSLLSVLGVSASLSFLPFHGLEIHIGALILLGISAWYMLKQLHNGLYCKIK